MIQTIEELSLNAWPGLQQILLDGWVLRFAGGYSRRANSAYAMYGGTKSVEEKVEICERIYREKELPPMFKLTPATEPADLDPILKARGYAEEGRASVRVLELPNVMREDDVCAQGWNEPNEQWFDVVAEMTVLSVHKKAMLRGIITNIACPIRLAAMMEGEQIVACGLGVLQGSHLGLFDVMTRPERRRQGWGRRLVDHLLDWGKRGGAERAYLQVVVDNTPAMALYDRLGFVEAYQYWYRSLR
jgi:ribosomal protein S18 acetylase RimI-like enzyme